MPNPLKVVLYWHNHQPAYRDFGSGQYQLPWAYLHSIKDYVDMAAHLEAMPQARAVINFVPILLEQIDDYAQQIRRFLQDAIPLPDPLLAALISQPPYAPFLNTMSLKNGRDKREGMVSNRENQNKIGLIGYCLRAHQKMMQRFLPYQELVELAEDMKQHPHLIMYLDEQYFVDLVVWYHLVWLGETVRRSSPLVTSLIKKGRGYTDADRRQLLMLIGELLENLIPRYQALLEKGQIELSFSPYAHPIMPLLLDVQTAHEALPDLALPDLGSYRQNGEARIHWHIQEGIKVFQKYFGQLPKGCWPSEGSLSEATVRLLEKYGICWVASGETMLRKSLNKSGLRNETTYRPYHLPNSQVRCFFRDDHLSDLIGVEYAHWHPDEAIDNMICHLEEIAHTAPYTEAQVVAIILDGENAWEFYPENGYVFLRGLYERLTHHPRFELTTFSQCLDTNVAELPILVAGSWMYGTFSTWIGDPQKNRGWEMLNAAKQVFDEVAPRLTVEQRHLAERQLALCEGSDWCWWFGDYNPASTVREFDRLYRLHLTHLYLILEESPPEYLKHTGEDGGDA